MEQVVSNQDKKDFMRWFLRHYQLRSRESVWILNYIISHEELLKNVHFVEQAEVTPFGCIMTTYETEGQPFRFFHNNKSDTNAEKAFHHIRLNLHQPFYIELQFKNKYICAPYAKVEERNPYEKEKTVDAHMEAEMDAFLAAITTGVRKKELMKQIDEALERKDRDAFMKLTDLYKHL